MELFSALVGSLICGFMQCRLGKSSSLVFYFVENREYDFYLLYARLPILIKAFLSRTGVLILIRLIKSNQSFLNIKSKLKDFSMPYNTEKF